MSEEQLPFTEWLPAPRARRSDPPTSHDAARTVSLRAGTQATRIAMAYRAHGDLIDDEAGAIAGLLHAGYWKRCSDLRRAGIIEPTGETRPGRSGEQQRVCRLTPLGVTLLGAVCDGQ